MKQHNSKSERLGSVTTEQTTRSWFGGVFRAGWLWVFVFVVAWLCVWNLVVCVPGGVLAVDAYLFAANPLRWLV